MVAKTAIVTGGSRGFGRALAALLTTEGWTVIVDGRDEATLREAPPGAVPVSGDVTVPDHRAALVDAAYDRSGRLDVLVNNASTLGLSPLPPMSSYPVRDLRAVYEVNVVAPLALAQLALPLLRASEGAIINLTSDAAVEAYPGWGGYGQSKAALEQLGAVMAAEEPQVRIWSLDPGDMRTQMHQEAFPGDDISDRPGPETVAPAVVHLLDRRPPSGRVRATDLLAQAAR